MISWNRRTPQNNGTSRSIWNEYRRLSLHYQRYNSTLTWGILSMTIKLVLIFIMIPIPCLHQRRWQLLTTKTKPNLCFKVSRMAADVLPPYFAGQNVPRFNRLLEISRGLDKRDSMSLKHVSGINWYYWLAYTDAQSTLQKLYTMS